MQTAEEKKQNLVNNNLKIMKKINLKLEGEELSREQLKQIVGGNSQTVVCVYYYSDACGGGDHNTQPCGDTKCNCAAIWNYMCQFYDCCDHVECAC